MVTFEVKRGDSFIQDMQFLQDDLVTPQDLSVYALKCTIYFDLVGPYFEEVLTTTIVDATDGLFQIGSPFNNVENWPVTSPTNAQKINYIYGDIQFTSGGARISTETFRIKVIEDYTDAR